MASRSVYQLWANNTNDYVHCAVNNDTNDGRYNFNVRQLVLIIFGRNVARYQMVVLFPISTN